MRRSILTVASFLVVVCVTAAAVDAPCDVDLDLAWWANIKGSIRPAARCESFVVGPPSVSPQ
jgi:hypothetical protein